MADVSTEEARLLAVHRAILKFNKPELLSTLDASLVTGYITNIIDLDGLEELATTDQIEYFIDGLVLGLVTSRLLEANVEIDQLPKSKLESQKQFQTGIDKEGKVRVNS